MPSPKAIAREALTHKTAFRAGLAVGFGAALWIAIGIYLYGYFGSEDNWLRQGLRSEDQLALYTEVEQLRQSNKTLKEEVDQSRALAALDKEAKAKLKLLITNLEADNGKLKQDLAFFETFVPGADTTTIKLRRLQVSKDTLPNQYRYKALVIQGSNQPPIQLRVQVLIKLNGNPKSQVMILPAPTQQQDAQFKLDLKRFARIDGLFQLPANAKLHSVELRLLEGEVMKASASLKVQ